MPFNKVPLKIKIFDSLVISALFLSLIPIRLAFITYVGDNWLGSFGVVTAIATIILYLAVKNKLGWFGRSIMRYFQKRHTKKRILFILQFTIATSMMVIFIYGVTYAEDKFDYEKQEILALLPNAGMDSMEKISETAIEEIQEKPEMLLLAVAVFGYYLIYDFDKYALAVWVINDMSEGLYLSFATIFLVEELEVMGLFTIFHFYGKKLTKK